MSFESQSLLAILAMTAITYATRLSGIALSGRLVLTGRAKAAFEAIPAAVLVALIAPTALATGPAETGATLITAVAATRLPLLATILIGVVSVVMLRAVLG